MSVRTTGIVLAGGRGNRFGGRKLEAPLEGVPLLAHALRAVEAVADEVVVAAPVESSPALPELAVPLRVVHDAAPDPGPLVALARALVAASGERAIVVGGDMPRLRPAVLRLMLDRLEAAAAAVVLAPPGGTLDVPRQVLPLALSVAAARVAANAAVVADRRALQALLDRLSTVELAAETWMAFDPDGSTLVDVDERRDLDGLRGPTPDRPGGS